jgi:hypothetical protein
MNFFSCARRFYEDMFHASPSMNEQIEQAMNQGVTILFLAIPVGNNSAVPKSFSPYSTSLIAVAGVLFQMFRDPNETNLLSVFLSLLGVTHHSTAHPSSIHSWQRNGVGLFMTIQVIKRCASIKGVTTIEIFLQCSEPSALHFYTMIGFWQKNKGDSDDCFGLLPEHVRAGLKSRTPSAFLRFPTRCINSYVFMKLYGYICRIDYCGIGVLKYGRTGYCLPLLHLRHQHVSICPDVDVRTVTSHLRDSKLNANPRVILSNMMTRLSTEDRSRYRRY